MKKLYNQLIYYKLLIQYNAIMLESKSINKNIICLVSYARFLVCFVPELGLCAVMRLLCGYGRLWEIMSWGYVVRVWGAPVPENVFCLVLCFCVPKLGFIVIFFGQIYVC